MTSFTYNSGGYTFDYVLPHDSRTCQACRGRARCILGQIEDHDAIAAYLSDKNARFQADSLRTNHAELVLRNRIAVLERSVEVLETKDYEIVHRALDARRAALASAQAELAEVVA